MRNSLVVLLFRTVAETPRSTAADPRHLGAEIGFLAVLHTWGQAKSGNRSRPVTPPARSRPDLFVLPARRAPHRRALPPRRAAPARRRAAPDPRHKAPTMTSLVINRGSSSSPTPSACVGQPSAPRADTSSPTLGTQRMVDDSTPAARVRVAVDRYHGPPSPFQSAAGPRARGGAQTPTECCLTPRGLPDIYEPARTRIAEYATYYGFDVESQRERLFAMHVLGLASSPTDAEKLHVMSQLARIASDAAKKKAWATLEEKVLVRSSSRPRME